ncbi:hypothetical protein FOA52_013589 [Chlamydomonas sp. UWO 241]|nr:hypothetical protein FOA52_013589 [Chlamydomonas sp. UWO 241]
MDVDSEVVAQEGTLSTPDVKRWPLGERIGSGSFGEAYIVTDPKTRKKYVLKRIRMARQNDWQRAATKHEIKLGSMLSHPYVVEFVKSWVRDGHEMNVVYGYCEQGDLQAAVERCKGVHFDEQQLRRWLAQMLLALQYMQSKHVLHRDLKTSNIFLTSAGDVQVGDFGLATHSEGGSCGSHDQSIVGTPHFMSPEVLSRKRYDYKTDVWSLGCVFYELSSFRPAFNAFNLNGLVSKITKSSVAPLPSHYSEDWGGIIKGMLRKDAAKRMSVEELLACPSLRTEVLWASERAQELSPGLATPPLLAHLAVVGVGGGDVGGSGDVTPTGGSPLATPTRTARVSGLGGDAGGDASAAAAATVPAPAAAAAAAAPSRPHATAPAAAAPASSAATAATAAPPAPAAITAPAPETVHTQPQPQSRQQEARASDTGSGSGCGGSSQPAVSSAASTAAPATAAAPSTRVGASAGARGGAVASQVAGGRIVRARVAAAVDGGGGGGGVAAAAAAAAARARPQWGAPRATAATGAPAAPAAAAAAAPGVRTQSAPRHAGATPVVAAPLAQAVPPPAPVPTATRAMSLDQGAPVGRVQAGQANAAKGQTLARARSANTSSAKATATARSSCGEPAPAVPRAHTHAQHPLPPLPLPAPQHSPVAGLTSGQASAGPASGPAPAGTAAAAAAQADGAPVAGSSKARVPHTVFDNELYQSRRASELGAVGGVGRDSAGGAVAAGSAPKLAWGAAGAAPGVSAAAARAALSRHVEGGEGGVAGASCVVSVADSGSSVDGDGKPHSGDRKQQHSSVSADVTAAAPAAPAITTFGGFQLPGGGGGSLTAAAGGKTPSAAGTPPFPRTPSVPAPSTIPAPAASVDAPTGTLTADSLANAQPPPPGRDCDASASASVAAAATDGDDPMSVSRASGGVRTPATSVSACVPVTLGAAASSQHRSSVATGAMSVSAASPGDSLSGVVRMLDMGGECGGDTPTGSEAQQSPVPYAAREEQSGVQAQAQAGRQQAEVQPAAREPAPSSPFDIPGAAGDVGRLATLERVVSLASSLHAMRRWSELGTVLSSVCAPQQPTAPAAGANTAAGLGGAGAGGTDGAVARAFKLGDSVVAGSRRGTKAVIRYYGPCHWADGLFVGLELDRPDGKHDGTIDGITYFRCPAMRGIFVRASVLKSNK